MLLRKMKRTRERMLVSRISRSVRDQNLTYLSLRKLRNIERCIQIIKTRGIKGDFLEAGVALGGSGVVLATLMPKDRAFHGYDVFGMIPAPGERDGEKPRARYEEITRGRSKGIGDDRYYGYESGLYDRVGAMFASFGVPVDGVRVSLHKGLFEDTLLPSGPIAMAHLDCDWYDPVKLCLERIYPYLSVGGFIVCDDYYDYDGAAAAVDEFVARHEDLRIVSDEAQPGRGTNLVLSRFASS